MWAAAAAMASALPKGVSGSVEMRLGASFVSAEDDRAVEIVELDLGLPLLLSAEAERLGRGVVFLVFTGVFLRVCEDVFLRSLDPCGRRCYCGGGRRAAASFCGGGHVWGCLACRVSQRGAARSSFAQQRLSRRLWPAQFRGAIGADSPVRH